MIWIDFRDGERWDLASWSEWPTHAVDPVSVFDTQLGVPVRRLKRETDLPEVAG